MSVEMMRLMERGRKAAESGVDCEIATSPKGMHLDTLANGSRCSIASVYISRCNCDAYPLRVGARPTPCTLFHVRANTFSEESQILLEGERVPREHCSMGPTFSQMPSVETTLQGR